MNRNLKQILIGLVILLFVGGLISSSALAMPMGASVTIVTGKDAKTGIPGSIVNYHLTIANGDAVNPLPITITASSAGGWTGPTVVPDTLTLPAGGSQDVTINVPIPNTATPGQDDVTTVYVKDSTNAVIGTKQLTTTVIAVPPPTTGAGRPQMAVASYSTGDKPLYGGGSMTLQVVLRNDGKDFAENVMVTLSGADFYPQDTGGVSSLGEIDPGESKTASQKFLIGSALTWANVASITATVSYTNLAGVAYTDTFAITILIKEPASSGTSATATPNVLPRPQLVVTGYGTDIDPLQPGSIFELSLAVKNLGNSDAKSVSVVVGGGVVNNDSGTPQPGGIPGGSGDLATFAPLGSSNVIFVGDINKEGEISVKQQLVVNVTAQPGAYPLKLSFVYIDTKGNRLVDDQVITLLIYSLPQVEVSFYRDAGFLSAGMTNILPIQITNLGKKQYVLGNLTVTADNADLSNNILMVGTLDPGGYYTLDANLTPYQEGPLDLKITINYTDDFNQPRVIETVIPVVIQPAPEIPPDMGGMDGGGIVEPVQPETFWDKVVRFFKGLFGLGSGSKEQPATEMPTEEIPDPVPVIPKG